MKRARANLTEETVTSFFDHFKKVYDEHGGQPSNIINYDETNFTDDPGKKWMLVRRGRRRVENIKDTSKTSRSIMWAGTAVGEMLPPCVVYKAKNTYEGWTTGAPNGTHFTQSERGWFNSSTFEEWFITIVLPYYEGKPGIKILIGDNFGSHFSAKIVKDAIKHNVIFVMLPTNSTHIFQPLDVVVFGPMKKVWRKVLDG